MNVDSDRPWHEDAYRIACCPEHGVHGVRDTCFTCGLPVDHIMMVPVSRVGRVWRALERQRDRWMTHAIDAGERTHVLREKLAAAERATKPLLRALKGIERSDGDVREMAKTALHQYALRYA